MGLLGKIQERADTALLEATARQLEAERAKAARQAAINKIIRQKLTNFADSVSEKLVELVPGGRYIVGDLVVTVEPFQRGAELPDPEQHSNTLSAYLVRIQGVDTRCGSVESVRWGTLKFIDYEGLCKTVLEAPDYMDLSAERVLVLSPVS